jgi:hypothetical protein
LPSFRRMPVKRSVPHAVRTAGAPILLGNPFIRSGPAVRTGPRRLVLGYGTSTEAMTTIRIRFV